MVPADIPPATPEPKAQEGQPVHTQSRQSMVAPPPAIPNPSIPDRRENVLRVAVNDDRLDVSAALLDQKGVERLIRVLQANKDLLPEELQTKAGSENPD